MSQEIGIINEIGDLGLGFKNLTPSDAKAYEAATQPQTPDNTVVVNEDKKSE